MDFLPLAKKIKMTTPSPLSSDQSDCLEAANSVDSENGVKSKIAEDLGLCDDDLSDVVDSPLLFSDHSVSPSPPPDYDVTTNRAATNTASHGATIQGATNTALSQGATTADLSHGATNRALYKGATNTDLSHGATNTTPHPDTTRSKGKALHQTKLSLHFKPRHSPITHSSSSESTSSRDTPSPLEPGTHLSELCFGPSAYPILPPLATSPRHCVLFNARTVSPSVVPRPYPDSFKDVWDANHVRMPCSAQSLYPVATVVGREKDLLPRWDLIRKALRRPISSSHDLETAILSFNSRYAKRWNFKTLHAYFEQSCSEREREVFFSKILPNVIQLALALPHIVTHALPLLKQQLQYSVTLSQQQVACLLANAFLCTFPRRNTTQQGSEYASYPSINFSSLFCGQGDGVRMNKLKCIIHYLHRITTSVPVGTVTFTRQVLPSPPKWSENESVFTKLCVDHCGTIEDNGAGMLQVDFANSFMGGGVLGGGCVQEEIRFLICPELIISRLFTERLATNESLVITGAERFSDYSGYGSGFEWRGRHDDSTVRDSWGRRQTQVVAIDALVFRSLAAQLKPGMMCRELNKAYCGFMSTDTTPCGRGMAVATGNWGCGAFGGNLRLKALLQLMAATLAKRDVMFFTFGNRSLRQDLCRLHRQLVCEGVTVGRVWRALVRCQNELRPHGDLYGFIQSALGLVAEGSGSCVVVASGNCDDNQTLEYSLNAEV